MANIRNAYVVPPKDKHLQAIHEANAGVLAKMDAIIQCESKLTALLAEALCSQVGRLACKRMVFFGIYEQEK